jgi:hypothetical protein
VFLTSMPQIRAAISILVLAGLILETSPAAGQTSDLAAVVDSFTPRS